MEEHSHCEICGTTTTVGEFLCKQQSCIDAKDEAQALKKRSMMLFIIIIIAVVVLTKVL